jgi:hypothetical protein
MKPGEEEVGRSRKTESEGIQVVQRGEYYI